LERRTLNEEQLNRASSLMIVANACVLWNAVMAAISAA
jgi:hypothetical protein